jgi:alpha-tubulin suppressor-like RCC1 family protein
MVPDRVKSLVAGATSFALLTEEGEVYSWGDPRYSRCLARTPSAEFPAEKPALVEVLGGIPISKIDTSGWMFGALSKEQDLYLWGSTKPGSNDDKGTRDLLGNGEEEIKLVEIEGVESVSDFGIGDGFIVVLAERGDIWVKGENENGQLGIGEGSKVVSEWTIVDRAQVGDANVVDVIVGELCTFLITSSRG